LRPAERSKHTRFSREYQFLYQFPKRETASAALLNWIEFLLRFDVNKAVPVVSKDAALHFNGQYSQGRVEDDEIYLARWSV